MRGVWPVDAIGGYQLDTRGQDVYLELASLLHNVLPESLRCVLMRWEQLAVVLGRKNGSSWCADILDSPKENTWLFEWSLKLRSDTHTHTLYTITIFIIVIWVIYHNCYGHFYPFLFAIIIIITTTTAAATTTTTRRPILMLMLLIIMIITIVIPFCNNKYTVCVYTIYIYILYIYIYMHARHVHTPISCIRLFD